MGTVSAIGTLITGIVAIVTVPPLARTILGKDEKIYGREAEKRAAYMIENMPEISVINPEEYKGGNIRIPQLNIKKTKYNSQTMGPEWSDVKQTAYYYYEENGKKMQRGWLLK